MISTTIESSAHRSLAEQKPSRHQELTDRQRQVYDYIRESIAGRGYPPTLREIGAHIGIRSTNGVNSHLLALERKSYIVRDYMTSRSMRVLARGDAPALISAPVSGRVLITAPTGKIPLYDGLAAIGVSELGQSIAQIAPPPGRHADLAVLAHGNALALGGIYAADVLYIAKTSRPEHGALVVVLVGNEMIVRVICFEKGMVRLEAKGGSTPPLYLRVEDLDLVLVGVVVAMFRQIGAAETG